MAHIIADLDANVELANQLYQDILVLEQQVNLFKETIKKQQSENSSCYNKLMASNNENEGLKNELFVKKQKIKRRNLFIIGENIGIGIGIAILIFLL